ncbi:MAG: VWA domain-containing protein [Spirochaetales bacterium]|nr:VWA domain-containing protein [Spirochaetales bacterium]
MIFARPEVLWTLSILPVVLAILGISYRRGRKELLRLGGEWRQHRLAGIYFVKSFFAGLLLIVTLAALIFAWSGPSWGEHSVPEHENGLDVALVFDVSWSMTATDVKPDRLAAGIEAARFILRTFPQTRFSLVAFKGRARILTPLTMDTNDLENWLNDLGPTVAPGVGSNLAAGLLEGYRSLQSPDDHHKAVILFTDGEARDGDAVSAARTLASRGVEVFAFGLGTRKGSTIRQGKGVLEDDFGFTVITKLNPDLLREIASETGGTYYYGADRDRLDDLQSRLTSLENPAVRGGVQWEPAPQYRLFLIAALLSLTGAVLLWALPWRKIL